MGDIYELRRDYMKKLGKESEGFWLTGKGQAIYNYKLAVKLGDKDAAEHYLMEYMRLGGTEKNMKKSLKAMHPMFGISKEDREGFLEYIGPDGNERLKQAEEYFKSVYLEARKDLIERAK
jgi:TPR repeat protein